MLAALILMFALTSVRAIATDTFTRYLQYAEQGDTTAQAYLGYLYYVGKEGAPQGYAAAARWFRAAAEAGSADAQYNLALMLTHGTGIEADPKQALTWYLKAAKSNHVQAQHNTAMMYLEGRGIEADTKTALKWLGSAAAKEHTPSQLVLAQLYHQGRAVARDLKQASYWYRRAALYGNPQAQYSLALLHRGNHGVTQDAAMERYWLQQAATQGHGPAIKAIAEQRAPAAGLAAATPANAEDLQALGQIHQWLYANENTKDRLALAALEHLAMRGMGDAQLLLGALYYQGRIVPRDRQLARHWVTRAARGGQLLAQYLYGHLLYTGEGASAPDRKQAAEWYRKAAARGLEEAQAILVRWETLDTEALREETLARVGLLLNSGGPLKLMGQIKNAHWRKYSTLPDAQHAKGPVPVAGEEPTLTLSSPVLAEVRAQYETGVAFELGAGVEQDDTAALRWFLKAARQGYPPAQYKVGMAYTYGIGTEPEPNKARKWLEQAALQNYAIAQRQLAMVLLGAGGKQERIHAYAWYSLAARSGERADLDVLAGLKRRLVAEEVRLGRQLAAQLADSLSVGGNGSTTASVQPKDEAKPVNGTKAADTDMRTGTEIAAP